MLIITKDKYHVSSKANKIDDFIITLNNELEKQTGPTDSNAAINNFFYSLLKAAELTLEK